MVPGDYRENPTIKIRIDHWNTRKLSDGRLFKSCCLERSIDQRGKGKMRKFSGIGFVWTLESFRNGEQGLVRSLEDAEFRFGRTCEEALEFGIRILPTGIISLIIQSGFEEEALETGFSLDISRKPILNRGWVNFEKLIGDDSIGPNWENPRSVFASSELEGTVEFVKVGNPCVGYNQIPSKVWIRVKPLTMPLISWAMTNKIYSCPKGDQRTLHDWVELTSKTPENKSKLMALPGPSNWNYTFLN